MQHQDSNLSRRDFIKATTLAGATLLVPRFALHGADAPSNTINIGLVGAGSQGRVLINSILKIPGVKFVAVADIWEYSTRYASGILERFDQPVNVYRNYEDMLEKEKLDAVLIATPDWVHAPQTITCLNAGLDVFCEKEMTPDVESARAMVKASQTTGKLLQIGHQRRSNPRYKHALRLIEKDGILGRITTINGQWNRPVQEPLGWPERFTMSDEELQQWGYANMEEFRNWRWYRRYSGGPIVDLGSHQIEVYNWFLRTNPSAVMASGGIDYYDDGREWYDNVMAVYEYKTADGLVRAFYQINNTSGYGGYYEAFMGDEGTLVISEDARKGYILREARAERREWEDLSERVQHMGRDAIELKIGETRRAGSEPSPEALRAEADLEKPEHQPHLENFFAAMRGEEKLACPGEVGFETCVTVLKVNEAVAAQRRLEFKPEEFRV